MRYKFRGKRIDGGGWVFGYYVKELNVYMKKDEEIHAIITKAGDYEVLPESVGQWTGLVDMDMVEAYEKDVVDVYFRDGEVERVVLIWDSNRFKYQLKSSDGSLWGFNDTLRVKIVGNIIDSPELMEV